MIALLYWMSYLGPDDVHDEEVLLFYFEFIGYLFSY